MKLNLISTGKAKLIEDSHRDMYWGGALPGSKNMLGVLLMELRDRLQLEEMKARYPITHDNDAVFIPDGTKLDIEAFKFHPFYRVTYSFLKLYSNTHHTF